MLFLQLLSLSFFAIFLLLNFQLLTKWCACKELYDCLLFHSGGIECFDFVFTKLFAICCSVTYIAWTWSSGRINCVSIESFYLGQWANLVFIPYVYYRVRNTNLLCIAFDANIELTNKIKHPEKKHPDTRPNEQLVAFSLNRPFEKSDKRIRLNSIGTVYEASYEYRIWVECLIINHTF